jgi:molecular chaperone GrpE
VKDAMTEEPIESDVDEAASDEPQPIDPMAALQIERDELYGRLQRVSADYQNYMKRAERELADAIGFARGDQLRSFIPLLDVLEQATQTEPDSAEGQSVFEGFKIVRDEFAKVLENLGVERIEPKRGDAFDPHLHEAMMQQPDDELEPNQIAQALQPGYLFKGRTLRAAKVAVVVSG